jgi:hypothetical protein
MRCGFAKFARHFILLFSKGVLKKVLNGCNWKILFKIYFKSISIFSTDRPLAYP